MALAPSLRSGAKLAVPESATYRTSIVIYYINTLLIYKSLIAFNEDIFRITKPND